MAGFMRFWVFVACMFFLCGMKRMHPETVTRFKAYHWKQFDKVRKLKGIGIILLTFFSCQNLASLSSDKTLTEKIEAEFTSEIIDLTQLNSFEWDELLILGPYSVIDNIEKDKAKFVKTENGQNKLAE